MKLIDTHTHLYLKDFEEDCVEVLERAKKNGVERFYLPAIDSSELNNLLLLEQEHPNSCFAMMALHPCSVKENFKEELSIVHNWLQKRKFAAIGETGLDFYWDKTFITEQYECFNTQIEWALQYELPVVLHTRTAIREAI